MMVRLTYLAMVQVVLLARPADSQRHGEDDGVPAEMSSVLLRAVAADRGPSQRPVLARRGTPLREDAASCCFA
ncbi:MULTISPECIES: hypothetical protein [unclassified Pseudofrankia]|uniref:hypothetical protein n=1 Tax=unclassified Pseudofrankia TaxID=2994372 RepID=UPI0008D93E34|nr:MULTISPECIES: hypothetical protein [unclassified Pseudofrankia]MDT3446743.1 hypothetical protein [Pseudofrankia sp. BMG5.37]OHV59193.1 hypothetical protein BCD48_41820 [Pseudofrankia sp. BMG5.36]